MTLTPCGRLALTSLAIVLVACGGDPAITTVSYAAGPAWVGLPIGTWTLVAIDQKPLPYTVASNSSVVTGGFINGNKGASYLAHLSGLGCPSGCSPSIFTLTVGTDTVTPTTVRLDSYNDVTKKIDFTASGLIKGDSLIFPGPCFMDGCVGVAGSRVFIFVKQAP